MSRAVPGRRGTPSARRMLVGCAALVGLCGCATLQRVDAPAANEPQVADQLFKLQKDNALLLEKLAAIEKATGGGASRDACAEAATRTEAIEGQLRALEEQLAATQRRLDETLAELRGQRRVVATPQPTTLLPAPGSAGRSSAPGAVPAPPASSTAAPVSAPATATAPPSGAAPVPTAPGGGGAARAAETPPVLATVPSPATADGGASRGTASAPGSASAPAAAAPPPATGVGGASTAPATPPPSSAASGGGDSSHTAPPAPVTAAEAVAGGNAEDLFNGAYADYSRGQYDLALAGFESARRADPSGPLADDAQYWAAETLYAKGQPLEAAAAFDKVIAGWPKGEKFVSAHLKKGIALYEGKRTREGAAELRKVVATWPTSDEARLARDYLKRHGAAPR